MKPVEFKHQNVVFAKDLSREHKCATSINETEQEQLRIAAVSGSAIRPPLGLIPKKFHDERVKAKRFNEVCGAIARYYDAGMKINIEWIEEYNELVECVGKHYR